MKQRTGHDVIQAEKIALNGGFGVIFMRHVEMTEINWKLWADLGGFKTAVPQT